MNIADLTGHVMPAFWREHLIPLILDRAQQAQEAYDQRVADLLAQAKQLTREYRALIGKPLGITGEVAEFAAARALGLTLASAREAGYDVLRYADGREIRIQIKGRCLAERTSGSLSIEKIRSLAKLVWASP